MEALSTGLNWSSDRYLLRELVGSGGMSQVYRAWDRQLDREVAVKVLHPHLAASADSRRRFSREARAVAKLHHPHILEIFDFSGDGEGAYIVTEFIQGMTLSRFAQETGFGLPQIGALAAHSLCLALEHAHAAGIVHRDLKPDNVMVSSAGVLKLMDFGIARFLDQGEKMTMTGAMVGSPAYMAPEVIEGKEADARSDLFSLGILCYWLFTGVLPFDAPNTSALLKRVLDAEYRDPRLVEPKISDSLAALLASMLMRSPSARPESAQAVRTSIAAALGEDGVSEPETELKAFLADPLPYRSRFRGELVTRLRTKAQNALAEKRLTPAVKLADRVLALEPDDVATRRILDGVSARRRRAKQLRTIGTALAGIAATAGLAVAGREVLRHWPPPPTPVVATGPSTSEPTPAPPFETASAAPVNTETPSLTEPRNGTTKEGSSENPAHARATRSPVRPTAAGPNTFAAAVPRSDGKFYDQYIVVGTWADVAVDGQPKAQGIKSTTLKLPLGRHVLTFSAVGRETKTQVVDITAQTNPPIRLALPFLPAKLRVNADPPDAMVFIDNQPYGSALRSPFSIKLSENPRPTVRVEVQKNGYETFSKDVQLQADEPREVSAKLNPKALP